MNIEFKGWDWTELVPLLGLDKEYDEQVDQASPEGYLDAEKAFAEGMAEKIRLYFIDHTAEETEALIKQLRAFLQKLIDASMHCDKPYFQGILNVQENETFLRCFAHNLTWMWT